MQNSTRHPDVSGVSLIESVESEREEILRRSSLYLDLCSHFPNSEPEWLAAARRLRQSESFQESDALLAEAHERFPQSLELAAEYARSPRKRGDEEEAVRRWQLIASKFPDQPLVSAEFCKALNSVSRFDEADLVSKVSIQRFTGHLHVFIEYARTAEARRDWSEADRRWNLVRERFPDAVSGHLGLRQPYCNNRSQMKPKPLSIRRSNSFRGRVSFSGQRRQSHICDAIGQRQLCDGTHCWRVILKKFLAMRDVSQLCGN